MSIEICFCSHKFSVALPFPFGPLIFTGSLQLKALISWREKNMYKLLVQIVSSYAHKYKRNIQSFKGKRNGF